MPLTVPALWSGRRRSSPCERGHLTLNGWIPTRLDLTGIVDDQSLAGLQALMPVEVVPAPEFPATVRGSGKPYAVTHRIRASVSLGGPTPVYLKAEQDAMADMARAVRDPSHTPLVTALDGASSLRVALAARTDAAR